MPGYTPQGFVKKTQQETIAEIQAALRAIDPTITFGEAEALTQLIATVSEQDAQLWDLAEISANIDPDSATGQRLTQVLSIVGSERDESAPSTATIRCTFSGAATMTAGVGKVRHATQPEIEFIVAETTVVAGAGTVDIPFEATVDGPLQVAAGQLTEIVTPVAGWTAATNPLDAVPGRNVSNDAEARDILRAEQAATGRSTVPAIRSRLSRVDGVRSLQVLNNRTLLPNADGVPPKSVEAIVLGGTDEEVATTLFEAASGTTNFHGNTTVVVMDEEGQPHDVSFTRPVEVPVYMTIDCLVLPSYIGTDEHAARIAATEEAQGPGDDVFLSRVSANAFANTPDPVSGILRPSGVQQVTQVLLGRFALGQTASSIAIAPREIAVFDTSRIAINASNATTV